MVNANVCRSNVFYWFFSIQKETSFCIGSMHIYIAWKCIEDWQSACHKLSHLTEFQPRAVQLQHRAVESYLFKEGRGEGEINKGKKIKRYDLLYSTSGVAVCQLGDSMHSSVFL